MGVEESDQLHEVGEQLVAEHGGVAGPLAVIDEGRFEHEPAASEEMMQCVDKICWTPATRRPRMKSTHEVRTATEAGSVRSPWPCTRSFTRAMGLNPLISKGLGLFANNVGSEACLWAVCKQCGLICGYCGSDVPRVCSECGPTSALVCGPASG